LPFSSADEGNEDKYTEYDQTYSADENDQPRWSIIATLTLLPSTFQKKHDPDRTQDSECRLMLM